MTDSPAIVWIDAKELEHLRALNTELLEALKAVLPLGKKELEYLDRGIGTATNNAAWLKVRAAIAKAEGR